MVSLAKKQAPAKVILRQVLEDVFLLPSEMVKIYNKGVDVHADPVVSYRYGAITIPHIDWIEPLRLECEDFANAIRTGAQPHAHGEVGLEVVRILATAQEVLEQQERQNRTMILQT